MAFNAAGMCLLWLALFTSPIEGGSKGLTVVADNAEGRANPIRRVVTMLQMMTKKVEEEGKKEEELFEKFMCYCKTSGGALSDSIAANEAKIPQVQSDIEEAESKLANTKQELTQAQTDRDAAKAAMAKATAIREKDHAAFAKEKSELDANVAALSKAIPAIEKGMAGGFLQTNAATLLKRLALSDVDLTDYDREALNIFLQGSAAENSTLGYVPKSGQIVGILKQMLDTFDKTVADLVAQENDAKKVYEELMNAKTKEVDELTKSIERKTVLIGELSVQIVTMKNELSDAEQAKVDDTKFLADLEKNCGTKQKEWDEIVKMRSLELQALAETIKILNDDDALDLFKKTLPSPSLLQLKASMDQSRRNALDKVKGIQRHHRSPAVDLIAMALTGKKVDFSKVIKMIDDMVALLAKEQHDDDHKKEYCEMQLDLNEDKIKELKHSIEDLEAAIADTQEAIKTLTEDIKALNDGIVALDKSVAEGTAQRKDENAEYTEMMASNTAAVQLIEFAKNRMNKFYNPKLYKPPPKRELSEEERITLNMGGTMAPTNPPAGIAGTGIGFVQVTSVHAAHKDAPPPPPETAKAFSKKSEESNGVISMMDLLIRDLEKETTEATVEEQNSQKEYEEMLSDAATKRAEDSKAITEKEGAKADAEADLTAALDGKQGKTDELAATNEYESQLHAECDWLLQNFELRKTSRAEEVDALKNAKAVLSGADFSFMQHKAQLVHRH